VLASLLFAPFFWSFVNYVPHIIDHYLPTHLYLLATLEAVCSRLSCVSFLYLWDDDDKKRGWNEKFAGGSGKGTRLVVLAGAAGTGCQSTTAHNIPLVFSKGGAEGVSGWLSFGGLGWSGSRFHGVGLAGWLVGWSVGCRARLGGNIWEVVITIPFGCLSINGVCSLIFLVLCQRKRPSSLRIIYRLCHCPSLAPRSNKTDCLGIPLRRQGC